MAAFGLPGGFECVVIIVMLFLMALPVAIILYVVRRTSSGRAPATVAGWLADPSGRHELRYWDGVRWTDSVSDSGRVTSDPA